MREPGLYNQSGTGLRSHDKTVKLRMQGKGKQASRERIEGNSILFMSYSVTETAWRKMSPAVSDIPLSNFANLY